MKTFAIGDIHGAHKALIQCIERSGIDKEEDQLIFVGDIVDGWYETVECVETLLKFKHLIAIRGNHDQWFMDFAETGYADPSWLTQGGQATFDSYEGKHDLLSEHMVKYFNRTKIYHIDEDRNYAFMHGGYNWHMLLENNEDGQIMWDRHMVETAQTWKYEKYDAQKQLLQFKEFNKIFVGHTSTQHSSDRRYHPTTLPAFLANLINLDTGAGWNGKLTIMDIDSLKYWQSDMVNHLYPEIANARR